MSKVSVEVCDLATSFKADVWAESLVQAVELANSRYPGYETKVLFTINSEAFFTRDPVPVAGLIWPPEGLEAAG